MTTEPFAGPLDPLPAEFFTVPPADPHVQNAALRATCPVRRIDYPPGGEAYVVADYPTVFNAFSDPRLSKDPANAPAWFRAALEESSPVLIHHMLSADPPRHTRLRKLVGQAFMPRHIEQSRSRIQEITDDLIDGFPDSGQIDLMDSADVPHFPNLIWPPPGVLSSGCRPRRGRRGGRGSAAAVG
jgi:cytochrome P450